MALGEGPGRGVFGMAKRRQGHRKDAHGGAIARVGLPHRTFERALGDEAANSAPARIADIHRPRLQPRGEFLANIAAIETAPPHQRAAEGEGHFGVVRDLPRRQAKPPAADDLLVPAMSSDDFFAREKLDRGAQRIADGEAEKGRERAVFQRGIDRNLPLSAQGSQKRRQISFHRRFNA